jgi:DNA-binding MarR family transcriptional regulator
MIKRKAGDMKKANSNQKIDSQTTTVAELRDIKALLVLLLMKSGASQTEIAGALGITQATVSRQFKIGAVKPLSAKTISSDGEK